MEYREAIEWCEEQFAHVYFRYDGYVGIALEHRYEHAIGPSFLTAVQKAMKLEEETKATHHDVHNLACPMYGFTDVLSMDCGCCDDLRKEEDNEN